MLAAFATGLVLAYRQRAEAIRSQRNQLELARNAALVARRAKEARKAERLVLQPSDDVQAHDAQDIADALDPTLHHPPPAVPPSPKMTREAEIAQEEYFCFTIRYEPSVYELAKQAGFDMERCHGFEAHGEIDDKHVQRLVAQMRGNGEKQPEQILRARQH